MTLTTAEYAIDCTSYATVAEADAYLADRDGFKGAIDWDVLETTQKEYRLQLAVELMEASYNWRGVRATKTQAREFPRFTMQDEALWGDDGENFDDLADLTEYCGLVGVDLPSVPTDIKHAQIEVAYQLVHRHMLTAEIGEEAAPMIRSIEISGGMKVTTADGVAKTYALNKTSLTSVTVIELLLRKYTTKLRGRLI